MNSFSDSRRESAARYCLSLCLFLALGVTAFALPETVRATDRYVDTTGADSGDCSSASCATIAYAVTQSSGGDTIHIAEGSYADESLTISTDNLTLTGPNPGHRPILERTTGGKNQPLLVIDGAKNVVIENIEFDMDQSYVAEGILASGLVDGLTIQNNRFVSSRSDSGVNSGYGFRNAISINDVRNSLSLPRVDGSAVDIESNIIDGVADLANGVFMRAGVNMDAGVGVISNNTITTINHDIHVRFTSVTADSSMTGLTISGNHLFGRGLEFDSPNATTSSVLISGNDLHAPTYIDDSTSYPADYSMVRLIHNSAAVPTTISGNTFSGYEGSYRGVLIENYPGVALDGNTFTPASGATDFVSLVLSNKEITTDDPPSGPLEMSLTATGNTFNGSGVAGAGRAVELLNDNSDGAHFGAINFGNGTNPGANNFDGNLRWYFHLDDYSCSTNTATVGSTTGGPGPMCDFLDYTDVNPPGGLPDTEVRPFPGDVTAADNNFDGVMPASMTDAQVNDLLARTFDKSADSQLGTVDYGLTPSQPIVYVDDGFSGSGYGDAKSFTSAAAACGDQTVYFAVNAFASISTAITHVQSGGTVCVAKGTYSESVALDTKPVQIIGDGNTASDTVIAGAVTISVSGADSAHPLRLQNLRVNNTAGYGVSVATGSHLAFDQVAFAGNGNAGLNINSVSDDVAISGSLFDGNTGSGIRTSSVAKVSNVAITASTFSNNAAGIILFGASGSGDGQITNWSIDASQFLSNDNADSSPFGGGIWLKTGGAGSIIDGFSVTGSTFADNGSSKALNQVGITVRARPDTTMQRVFICGDSFSETATPGTQLTGINVFDDTGGTGYKPITVCANDTFNGLGHSVSGLEQFDLRNSEPTVNIIGGTIDNTEYINPQASVALALNGPAATVAGVATGGYTAQLTNTGSSLTENVLVDFELSRPGDLSGGDITLEYYTGSGYATIPLSVCGVDLCGSFGPPGTGFAVASGYNATTTLRFTSIRSGPVAVTASVVGVDSQVAYATSAQTVNVAAADAANIAANSATSISGTAGTAASPLPSVKVTDQYGNPVPGYTVEFNPGSNSGVLSGTSPATDADGIATLGGWTLGTAASESVAGSGGTTLSGAPVTFTATVASNFDLSGSFSSATGYVQYGKTVDYVIVVSNAGPSTASNPVTDNLPPELDGSSATWDCFSHTTGATCASGGTGDLSDTPMIPGGGSVTYVLSASALNSPPDETISDQASVGTSGDSNASNNTATAMTQIVLFRDGFESGSNGAVAAGPVRQSTVVASLDDTSSFMLEPSSAASTQNRPVAWLSAREANGRKIFRIESLRTARNLFARVVYGNGRGHEGHTHWVELDAQPGGLALAAGTGGSQAVILLGADDASVQAGLPDGVVLPLQLSSP